MKSKLLFDVPQYKKLRVIIDTDAACEADDPFAIAQALMSPKLMVKGILAEHFAAEGSVQRSYDEVLTILDAMDIEFHMSLAKLTGNQYIEQTMRDLMDKCQRFMYIQNANSVERLRTAINEHYEVMNAIAIRNEALATKLMRSHLENSMYAYITTRENSFKLN